jgi:hypothetical protein
VGRPEKKLTMVIKNGEHCLKTVNDLKIQIDGSSGIFTVGEGQDNHFSILGEKRFWGT